MKQDVLKIINRLRDELHSHVVLTREERFHIFNAIQKAAEKQNSAFVNEGPIVSPLSEKFIAYKRPLHSHIFFMSKASIALVVMCLVAGSVSLAAEQALPGDTLYSVKTNFNENVQSMLTFSPASRAKLEAQFAERRLIEAQKLALTDPAAAAENNDELEASFKKHSEEFHKNLEEAKQSSGVTLAADLAVGFKATLKAHESTLATIAAANGTGASALSNLVTKEVEGLNEAEKVVREQFSTLEPADAQLKVSEHQQLAERSLDQFITSSRSWSSSPDAMQRIDEYIVAAEAMIAAADTAAEMGRHVEAFTAYQQAIVTIETAQETLRASALLALKQEQTRQALSLAAGVDDDTSLASLEAFEASLTTLPVPAPDTSTTTEAVVDPVPLVTVPTLLDQYPQ